jgi:hypothetical protein
MSTSNGYCPISFSQFSLNLLEILIHLECMMVSSGVTVIFPLIKCFNFCYFTSKLVATPLWAKCEGEAHTPKSGNLESFGTPKNSELELKGQNTSHWGVLSVIGKVLKCRCLNWPRIGHLNI